MKGFILAAGFGKRMGTLTEALPKPLLPVAGVPLVYYSLFNLYNWGIREVFINLHYYPEKIEEELRGFPHLSIQFSREATILGTAGGVRKILDQVHDEWLLVLNPDSILIPTESMHPTNLTRRSKTTGDLLGLARRSAQDTNTAIDQLGDDSLVFGPGLPFYYMGYSFVRTSSLAHLEKDRYAEMGDIWQAQAKKRQLAGFQYDGSYFDAGTEEAYRTLPTENLPLSDSGAFKEFMRFRSER
ncbi:MAG: NTP transferase domain-containing protein [Spirochaetia bacterium]|nr:NTP transferase domain-containing protein [Spirochaetia bacterium]